MSPASDEPGGEGAAMQRVRVGALGLACVFLLVMLAAAFLHATGDGTTGNVSGSAIANMAEPAEPLAQLGVAPGNAPVDTRTPPASPNGRPNR